MCELTGGREEGEDGGRNCQIVRCGVQIVGGRLVYRERRIGERGLESIREERFGMSPSRCTAFYSFG